MIINVLVEVRTNKNNQLFSYMVPASLQDKIKVGIRVLVPFNNKPLEGFVLEIQKEPTKQEYKLKEILNVIDDEPVLNAEMIELGKYMSEAYLCSLISCYQAMLPVALKAKNNTLINIKEEKYIVLNKSDVDILESLKNIKGSKQKEILQLLLDKKIMKKSDINNSSSLKTLLDKELVREERKEIYRLTDEENEENISPKLTEDQIEIINEFFISKDQTYLLHGVTGSGKTEVYMNIIDRIINEGKNAIVLVPEIALTTQLINIFKKRFGKKIAVLHSRLSDGEKYDEWRKIERNETSIVIGARSAIFAPLKNIGVIVIDEEHENTYKQDNNPRYSAIEIATYRAKKHNAKILIGSATPSLESYARARKGLYKLLELKTRINNQMLPKVHVVDMRESIKKGYSLFSKELLDSIKDRLNKKEQIMILLNRRGYANFLTCKNCGYTFKCPNCDITLTYHKTSDTMRCHYCGYGDKRKTICPECNSQDISSFGTGTEKIEEELNKLFSDIRIVRMDLDTTSKKGSHSRIIKDFNEYKYDLLLGTQMIAKGLDFSRVTLVGVINGDTSLNIPDFRSGEKTFQLLSQVAGRSGRSEIKGEVIFQTFNKDHYVIEMAKNHDYFGFYSKEMTIRKKLNYPPYCFIALIKILCSDYQIGYEEAKKIGDYFRKNLPDNIVLGPTNASLLKIKNIYRFQCIIKYRNKDEIIEVMKKAIEHYENNSKVKIEIDFNPIKL
ncbi:MAG: primosomal protein N' [Bacilli bacterium]|nr:primosomal protein N' [Bacilli bacterium]